MFPVYVISLTAAQQRRQSVSTQLFHENLAFEFFDAIEVEPGDDRAYPGCDYNLFELNTGRYPVHGEIGCFLSHRSLWVHCVNINRSIVILEDDFKLSSSISRALSTIGSYIQDFGFIRLQSELRSSKRKIKEAGEYTLWRYTKAPHCTMAYVINPEAARKLIAVSDVIEAPVDVFIKMFWEHGQPLYCMTPYPVSDGHLSYTSFIGVRDKKPRTIGRRLSRNVHRTKHWFRRARANALAHLNEKESSSVITPGKAQVAESTTDI